MPAFQPYRGKPAVRNDRGDGGNVGIIRSPLRATVPPDCGGRSAMVVPTATAIRSCWNAPSIREQSPGCQENHVSSLTAAAFLNGVAAGAGGHYLRGQIQDTICGGS